MKAVVMAARPWAISTALAVGQWPMVAPPVTAENIHLRILPAMERAQLIYICLHSLPDQPYMYGGDWSTTLSSEHVRSIDCSNAIVYLAGCFGVGPIASAFIESGARCIVGDRDTTWSGFILPTGSNKFGRIFVRNLRNGMTTGKAYDRARTDYQVRSDRDQSLLDSLALIGSRNATL